MRFLILGLAVLALAACGSPAEQGGSSPVTLFADGGKAAPSTEMASADAAVTQSPGSPAPAVGVPAGAPMLAYSYRFGLEAPAGQVRSLAARHEAACSAAGPTLCQVTSSSVRDIQGDRQMATLEFRAAPAWLKRFRDGLAGDAKAAGGRISSSGVESEDLSREIVDTEARLRAMTTLRDRLQALLASRPGKLSDLVEIERELARVQGDIDSAQSQLTVMRGRVQMSAVTIQYESAGLAAPRGMWSPLIGAVTDFLGIIVFTLAAMVRLVAWLAPWVALGAGLWWVFRKRLPPPRWPFRRKTSTGDGE